MGVAVNPYRGLIVVDYDKHIADRIKRQRLHVAHILMKPHVQI